MFCFCFISFLFRFRCENKQKTLFSHRSKKFCFRFSSFCFEWKWWQFLLLFCFVFASFHFSFASDFYVSHRCETSEKHRSEKNFVSVSLHFASIRKWRPTLLHTLGSRGSFFLTFGFTVAHMACDPSFLALYRKFYGFWSFLYKYLSFSFNSSTVLSFMIYD